MQHCLLGGWGWRRTVLWQAPCRDDAHPSLFTWSFQSFCLCTALPTSVVTDAADAHQACVPGPLAGTMATACLLPLPLRARCGRSHMHICLWSGMTLCAWRASACDQQDQLHLAGGERGRLLDLNRINTTPLQLLAITMCSGFSVQQAAACVAWRLTLAVSCALRPCWFSRQDLIAGRIQL